MATTFYQDRESPVHRLNPITKLVAVLVVLAVVFAMTDRWWVTALVLVGVVVPAAAVSRCGGRLVAVSWRILVPILVVLTLVQGLFFPEGRTVLLEAGPARVTVEGLLFALGVGLRICVLVLSFILLLLTTHPAELMAALMQRGMPPRIAYVISSTLQVIPAFRDRADAILLAQRARGLRVGGGVGSRVRALLPLVTPLVLGLFTDVEERSTAMEARAFGRSGKRTALTVVPDSTAQRAVRWLMVAIGAAVVVLAFTGGNR